MESVNVAEKPPVKMMFRLVMKDGLKFPIRQDFKNMDDMVKRMLRMGDGFYEARRINRGGRFCYKVEYGIVYKIGQYSSYENPWWWDDYFQGKV